MLMALGCLAGTQLHRALPLFIIEEPNMARMVMCAKLGRELPGLDRAPVPGPMGKRILENISAQAWDMWKAQSVLLINHYGLNPALREHRQQLYEVMKEFLGLDAI